ncbi:MAG: hypothetical protein KAH32_01685 [Chlamydiia bacterium]|nr:hypothetical protein [Chlamydiia bacterium]
MRISFKWACLFVVMGGNIFSNNDFSSFALAYSSGVPYCSKIKDYTGSLSIYYQYGLSNKVSACSSGFVFKVPDMILGVSMDGIGIQKIYSCGLLVSL